MKVRIKRKTSMDLVFEGNDNDISVRIDNVAALIIKYDTYTTGYKKATVLIIPWHDVVELVILE